MVRRLIFSALVALFLTAPAAAKQMVDLNLVLAVDCSGSVDAREFALQLDGIASAIRDPEVLAAIAAGPHKSIGVSLLLWADPDEPKLTSPWQIIDGTDAAQSFADELAKSNIRIGGGTGIGVAIGYGISVLKSSPFTSTRNVIDVSGDGEESWELREPRFKLLQARALARDNNVTVNGLAIMQDVKTLDAYYRDNMITGPGAFVERAANYEAFAEAMKRKLLREILPEVAVLSR
jgi:hypothetical protein